MDARQANILVGEIAAVVAAMRQNSKWAMVPRYHLDSGAPGDDPLLEKFRSLRKSVLNWTEWSEMRPTVYLQPFLEVVKSVETSGPITGTALSSIYSLLNENIIGPDVKDSRSAMHSIVDAVTHCRFEATDPSSDEIVLSKILQVLLSCVTCDSGEWLVDDDVCNIVQACYRIGHQNGKSGSLLQQLSRSTLIEITRCIFKRLKDMHKRRPEMYSAGDVSPNGNGDVVVSAGQDPASTPTGTPMSNGVELRSAAEKELGEATPHASSSTPSHSQTSKQYGLNCVIEVFRFLASLVATQDEEHDSDEDSCIFGLNMIRVALESGVADFSLFPELIDLVRDELMSTMLRVANTVPNLTVLSIVCSIVFLLYTHLRSFLRLQLEAFISCVLLRIADGEDVTYEQQEVALESLVALCMHPTFMVDMYANLDCSIDRANVFESVCNLLSKNAFPVNSPLASIHTLSLEGLLAIFSNLFERSRDASSSGDDDGDEGGVKSSQVKYEDPEECSDSVWKVPSTSSFASWAKEIQYKKYLKRRITVGVDHFNRDPKKGFEFLQSINILPSTLTPESVAQFLFCAKGLSKNVIGELLGDPDAFYLEVLQSFVGLFDFAGISFDHAIRLYLESFFLPGEAQKIGRILEAFAKRYYAQCPGIFASTDAAYVLSYSLLMLHTDAHNAQVKKKMTVEDFLRNNRKINEGEDLPREMLVNLFNSISQHEIRIQADGNKYELSHAQWLDITKRSSTPEGILVSCSMQPVFDYDMFAMIWGPTIAAISVVFDHAEDESIVQYTIDGFLLVANLASVYQFGEAIDNLVISLCKFATNLSPQSSRGDSDVIIEDSKAMLALVTMFCVVNQHGDAMRESWKSVVDCILRLHRLRMLPKKVTDMEEVRDIVKNASRHAGYGNASGSQTSILQSVSNFLTFDSSKQKQSSAPSEEIEEAEQRISSYIESCHIEEIFTESKFLEAESLQYLVTALIWSAGETPKGIANNEEDEARALLCLDLLISTTIRNRDRIEVLWNDILKHLESIVDSATLLSPLVEKGVFGLLRICQRLVPYKEDIADELLRSLQLVLKLDAKVADILAAEIFSELLQLVKASTGRIKTESCWTTFCSLLRVSAHHSEASPAGFEILENLVKSYAVTKANLVPLLEVLLAFIDAHAGGEEQSIKAVELVMNIGDTVVKNWKPSDFGTDSGLFTQWLKLVEVPKRACVDYRPAVRNQACILLQSLLLSSYSMEYTGEQWGEVMRNVVLSIANDLVTAVKKNRGHEYPEMDKTARIAVLMLSKCFLQYLPSLVDLPEFSQVWMEALSILDLCNNCNSDELAESVPEALKNMLLVMATQGILRPDWSDSEGVNLWNVTWQHARRTSPNLSPDMLQDYSINC